MAKVPFHLLTGRDFLPKIPRFPKRTNISIKVLTTKNLQKHCETANINGS